MTGAAAGVGSSSYGHSSFVRNILVGSQASAAVGGRGRTRMLSDDGQFFADPDAPAVVDGVGPPGPLVDGDQVGCNIIYIKLP